MVRYLKKIHGGENDVSNDSKKLTSFANSFKNSVPLVQDQKTVSQFVEII